jgi:mono/diheme cytochrome c family protein
VSAVTAQPIRPTGAASSRRLALALSLCMVAGCDWHIRSEPPPRPVPAEDVVDFSELYATYCAGCHGPDGKLGPAPPLNDPIFLTIVSDEDLLQVVSNGRRGTLMPAWSKDKGGTLTPQQVQVLADGLKKKWGSSDKPTGDIPPYHASGGGDREAGAEVFMMACAGCHGEQGRGKRKDGKGVGAVNDAVFLSLLSDQALRRLVITGRPDLGMPPYNGKGNGRSAEFTPLTSKDVSDVVALMAYWRTGGGK